MRSFLGRGCRRVGLARVPTIGRGNGHRMVQTPALLQAPPLSSCGAAAGTSVSIRTNAGVATPSKPSTSALSESTRKLRSEFQSREVTAQIAADADLAPDTKAVLDRIAHEIRAEEGDLDVLIHGEPLATEGRQVITTQTPLGPEGGPAVRKVRMVLPTAEDVRELISKRRAENYKVDKPEELASILEKFLKEKYYGKRSDQVGLIAAWAPKTFGDSNGEFAEIGALMELSLKTYNAALKSSKNDFQFELARPGAGKECLVMPPSNFALLGLKDMFHNLLEGYRVLMVVQPRYFAHYREIQQDLADCGLPVGLLEILPGITPEADPAVLHEALRNVDRLQFTGSSPMFKSLVKKAIELGNLRLEHAGEVSGLNKLRLDGVSATHPAVKAGAAWAAMGNNGELCTSTSLLEFDPATGDTAEIVKTALESHSFNLGRNPTDPELNVLLKDGKSSGLEVMTAEPASGFREWWEKTVLAVPKGGSPNVRTNQSLGHCIYSPTIERSLAAGVREDASCIYTVGTPQDTNAPSARAGTTGAKLPESVFGGMKSYTYAVAGDHDGVGTVQTLLNLVKRRGANWRDQEESYSEYELTETAEMLRDFLAPRDQQIFTKQMASVLDIMTEFTPEVSGPYNGQPLVGAEGHSQLMTLAALRPSRKNLLIPPGVSLSDDIVKLAMLCEMSPLRELPVDMHIIGIMQAGKLKVTDPLKSFLRVVEKCLGWRVHAHSNYECMIDSMRSAEYPPYFYCVKDKHMFPPELLMAVADQGGYFYEGLPSDALTLFRSLTTTQAWTVACTEGQVEEARAALLKMWNENGLREEPHEKPEIRKPLKKDDDIGGGFGGAGGDPMDDKDWGELSSDSSSSDSDDDDKKSDEKTDKFTEKAETTEKPAAKKA